MPLLVCYYVQFEVVSLDHLGSMAAVVQLLTFPQCHHVDILDISASTIDQVLGLLRFALSSVLGSLP